MIQKKAILRTYTNDISYTDETVYIDYDHNWSDGPYADTIPFTVGSNQVILDPEDV